MKHALNKRALVYLMRAGMTALMLVLAACVPWPHHERYSPPIGGTVIQSGHPVVGAEVVLTYKGDSGPFPAKRAVTDSKGRFKLDPIEDFDFFLPIAGGDRFNSFVLTIKSVGHEYVGYDGPSMGSELTTMQCDLDGPIAGLSTAQFCKSLFGIPASETTSD